MGLRPGQTALAVAAEIITAGVPASAHVSSRPFNKGMPNVLKYAGLTRRYLANGRSAAGRESPGRLTGLLFHSPLRGIKFVTAADSTPGSPQPGPSTRPPEALPDTRMAYS